MRSSAFAFLMILLPLSKCAVAEVIQLEFGGVIDSVRNFGMANVDLATDQPISFHVRVDYGQLSGNDIGFPSGLYRHDDSQSFARLEALGMKSTARPDSVAGIAISGGQFLYEFPVELYSMEGTKFPFGGDVNLRLLRSNDNPGDRSFPDRDELLMLDEGEFSLHAFSDAVAGMQSPVGLSISGSINSVIEVPEPHVAGIVFCVLLTMLVASPRRLFLS